MGERDVVAHAGRLVLALGALGVVFGDLGTSPLYTEQAIFSSYRATSHITTATVYGVASLIFWALMVVVSIKYAGFIMRAHNRGDGGIMALTALLQRQSLERNEKYVGQTATVLIEGASEETDLLLQGRMPTQAQEIDGQVLLPGEERLRQIHSRQASQCRRGSRARH